MSKNEQLTFLKDVAKQSYNDQYPDRNTIDDLLKTEYLGWLRTLTNSSNHIIRNVTQIKTYETGLTPLTASIGICVDSNIPIASTLERIKFVDIPALSERCDAAVLRQLCKTVKSLIGKTNEYCIPSMLELSDEEILAFFMKQTKTYIRNNVTLLYNDEWDWLTFMYGRVIVNHGAFQQINAKRNVTFMFKFNILDKLVKHSIELYMTKHDPDNAKQRRYSFCTIMNRKSNRKKIVNMLKTVEGDRLSYDESRI